MYWIAHMANILNFDSKTDPDEIIYNDLCKADFNRFEMSLLIFPFLRRFMNRLLGGFFC